MTSGRWRAGLAAVAAAAGCGSGSKLEGTTMAVVAFRSSPPTPDNLTSLFQFLALVTDAAGLCPLSSSATLAIDGQDVSFPGCLGTSQLFGGNPPFTLRVADGGDVGEADVDDLAPGAEAVLSPDTSIPAGTDFAISIPPELQGRSLGQATITNAVDGTVSFPSVTTDGQSVTMQAPPQAGSYIVMVATGDNSTPLPPGHIASCTGFGHCGAQAADLLGPVALVVAAASAGASR
jgi:hypothetical protein